MNETTKHLEKLAHMWEAYEHPLAPAQCDDTLQTIRDLQATLRSLPTPTSLLALVIEHHLTGRDISDDTNLLIEVPNAIELADEACLLLATYRPHAQSQARRHLEKRREVLRQIQCLLRTASDIQARVSRASGEKTCSDVVDA